MEQKKIEAKKEVFGADADCDVFFGSPDGIEERDDRANCQYGCGCYVGYMFQNIDGN